MGNHNFNFNLNNKDNNNNNNNNNNKPKILITGWNGLVGSEFIKNIDLSECILLSTKFRETDDQFINLGAKIIYGNVQNIFSSDITELLNLKCIYHLAAYVKHTNNPDDVLLMEKINIEGTKNIIHLAKINHQNNCKLVFMSTSGVVGCSNNNNNKINEDAEYSEESYKFTYYRTKIECEKLIKASGVDYTILRPSMILGNKNSKNNGRNLIKKLKKIPLIINGGIINMISVDDIVNVLTNPSILAPNKIYNIGGVNTDVFSLCQIIKTRHTKQNVKVKFIFLDKTNRVVNLIMSFIMRILFDPVYIKMSELNWNIDSGLAIKELNYKFSTLEKIVDDNI